MKRKTIWAWVIVILVFLGIWFVLTLRISVVFKIDGVACSDCVLEIVDMDSMEEWRFPLDSNGRTKLPGLLREKNMLCTVTRDGVKLKSMFSPGFRRGTTTVDIRWGSLHTEYEYRYLIYQRHEESETWSGSPSP